MRVYRIQNGPTFSREENARCWIMYRPGHSIEELEFSVAYTLYAYNEHYESVMGEWDGEEIGTFRTWEEAADARTMHEEETHYQYDYLIEERS